MVTRTLNAVLLTKIQKFISRDEKWTKECVYSLHKLNAVLRDGPDNCICLAESGFLKNLLVQFTDLLTTGHPQNYGNYFVKS